MRVVGVIQARCGSTRLPKKVLLPICGRAMILRLWDRLRLAKELDGIVAAIPQNEENDILAAVLKREGIEIVRGPERQLTTRLFLAVNAAKAHAIVRITADEPMISPRIVDHVVSSWRAAPCDYLSNVFADHRTWPDGLDCEVMTATLLHRLRLYYSDSENSPSEWLWYHSHVMMQYRVLDRIGGDLGRLRWTVDTVEDLAGAQVVFSRLPEGFGVQDVLDEFGEMGLAEIGKRFCT